MAEAIVWESLLHDAWLEETRLPALYRTFLDLGQIDPEWRKLPVQTRAQRMVHYKSHWILYFIRRLSKHKNRNGRLIAYNFRDLPDKDWDPIWYKAYVGVQDPMSLDIVANRLRLGLYKLDAEGRKTVRADLGRVFGVVVENGNRSSERYRDAVDMQAILNKWWPIAGPVPGLDPPAAAQTMTTAHAIASSISATDPKSTLGATAAPQTLPKFVKVAGSASTTASVSRAAPA